MRSSRPASSATTPTPEALSLAPGAFGVESVCAMTIRRQVASVSRTPITLRERPSPGTSKDWIPTRRPARSNARATSRWARASVAPAAGRGPQEASRVAIS